MHPCLERPHTDLSRLDLDLIQLPPGYLKNFPNLTELQITSTLDFPELNELPITKLTIVQRVPQQVVRDSNSALPVRNLARLTHLHIVSQDGFDPTYPLLDFDSLPSLECLCLSQEQYDLGTGFSYVGQPSSVKVLSLVRATPNPLFVNSCSNLRHLYLFGSLHQLTPLHLEKLEILELVHCPIASETLQSSQLPALKHFLECARAKDMNERASNPFGVFTDRMHELETMVAIYTGFSQAQDDEKTLVSEDVNERYDIYTLKRGHVSPDQPRANFSPAKKVRYLEDGNFPWPALSCDIVSTDVEKVFIQTRICALTKDLEREGTCIPLEHLYYNNERNQTGEYRWGPKCDRDLRLSFMGQMQLLY